MLMSDAVSGSDYKSNRRRYKGFVALFLLFFLCFYGTPCLGDWFPCCRNGCVPYVVLEFHECQEDGNSLCVMECHSELNGCLEAGDWNSASEFCMALYVDLTAFFTQAAKESILITWETASEIDNAGFHLWRSDAENGEYLRITEDLIPADGGPTWGASYTYEDFDVKPNLTYYYKLEDIAYNGVSAFHGPVSATLSDDAILLLSPEDGASASGFTPPTFEWDGAGPVRFKLQFSTAPAFKKKVMVLPSEWIEEESYTPSQKEWRRILRPGNKGKTVYWRVYGEDEAGEGFVSETFGMTIEN